MGSLFARHLNLTYIFVIKKHLLKAFTFLELLLSLFLTYQGNQHFSVQLVIMSYLIQVHSLLSSPVCSK